MASTDATYPIARLAERADERYRALIRRHSESQPSLAVAPPVRDGMRAWVDAWLRLLRPRNVAHTAQMVDTAMPEPLAGAAPTMADAWVDGAFIGASAAKHYPSPPDLLAHSGVRRFRKASERRTKSAPNINAAAGSPSADMPMPQVAWVSPPVTAETLRWSVPQDAAEVVAPVIAAYVEPVAIAPVAPTPAAPVIPVARVMSLLAEARPFRGLDATAYSEHIAIKTDVLANDHIAEAAPTVAAVRSRWKAARERLWQSPAALARSIGLGIKTAGRAVAAGAKKIFGGGKRGVAAAASGAKTAAKAVGRAIGKSAVVVTVARKLAASSFALLVLPLSLARSVGSWRPRFNTPEGAGLMAAAVPFQPDIDEIIEEPAPRSMRSLHYFIVAMFVILVVIASVIRVEIIVQGAGQLTTETPPILLQTMERGIIREIKVKAGDIVTKGQVLASLDPTFSNADVGSLKAQHHALTVALRRIEAEMMDKDFTVNQVGDPHEDLQAALYLQRRSQYAARVRAYDEEINRWEGNIKATSEDRNFLAQQVKIANEVEGMRTQLWQSRLTSKIQVLDSQNTRIRYEKDLQSAIEKLTELQHNLSGRQAERQAFTDDWRRQLLEDMLNKRTELTKLNEQLSKAARLQDMVLLTAPEDGVVLDVARRSVGSVMREAEPLITMVPSNAKLIAEIMVASGDVGYATLGDRVVIKVDAFPYQRHGPVEGRLMSISEESMTPGRGGGSMSEASGGGSHMPSMSGALHRARVALINTKLEKMPETARLTPGMTVSAEINVGRRSVISYFLYPITRALQESVREP